MKLIIGLGNPGKKYELNRHNVGFIFASFFADNHSDKPQFSLNNKFSALLCEANIDGAKVVFVKPQTYMNQSGEAVSKLKHFYKVHTEDIVVCHDDLDITFGQFKIQQGKGPKVHNGIASLEQHLGSQNFWRARIGIENRPSDIKISGHDYVLSNFTQQEQAELPGVFTKIAEQLMGKVL